MKLILSFIISLAVYGLNADSHGPDSHTPKISDSGPVWFGSYVTLTCMVDKLDQSISWMHENSTKFSCDPPFSAGSCFIEDGYMVMVDTDRNMFQIMFTVMENVNDWNWTCSHNNTMSDMLDLDAGMKPVITQFDASSTTPNGMDNLTLTCDVHSSTNLTSLSFDHIGPARNLMNVVNPLRQMMAKVTFEVPCTDHTYKCCATNKYGIECSILNITVICPITLQKDINTEVTVEEGVSEAALRIWYSGSGTPEGQWYREDSMGGMKMLSKYRASWSNMMRCPPSEFHCFTLIINSPIMEDTGKYTYMINDTNLNINDSFYAFLNVTAMTATTPKVTTDTTKKECEAVSEGLSFGAGIGVGIAIGLGAVFFTAGAIYGCRKS